VHRVFSSFRGERFEELLAWLRRILLHNASNSSRHFEQTAKQNVAREIAGDQAAIFIANLGADVPTPSSPLVSLEQRPAVEKVLSLLPEEMNTAIELRNKENLSFAEIGARMQCSSAAARKLWARAIERMQQLLLNRDDER
jgi:RNA polymerase sigma-70 factor (ECF subfamily)